MGARVLILEDMMFLDVALAWGPLGNRDVLKTMSFHLARRYVSVRWDGQMPLPQNAVMEHLSNHHLIAKTPALAKALRGAKPGDLLVLEGQLVDVVTPERTLKTSLSRTDIGNGACEIVYVEDAQVMRPAR